MPWGVWEESTWESCTWNGNVQKIGRDQIRANSITPRRIDKDATRPYIQQQLDMFNAIDVSGGAGGNGANGLGTGGGGRGGRGGDGGNADFFRADTGVWTRARSAGAASGTAADAPSGISGTTGGAGEVVRLSI